MPAHPDWFSLAVISSASASIVGVLQKAALGKNTTDPVAFGIYFQLLVSLIGLPLAVLSSAPLPLNLVVIFLLTFMAIITASGNLLYYFALKSIEISQAAILSSTSTIWLLLGGFIFLNEQLTLNKLAGVFLILSGIFIVYFNKKSLVKVGAAQGFIVASAISSGLTGIFDKYLLASFSVSTYQVVSYFLQASMTAILVPGSVKNIVPLLRFSKTNLIIVSSAVLLNFGALSYFSALKSGGEITKINPILQGSAILTIILGVIFFKERSNLLKKFIGMAVIISGIILIKSV